MSSNREEWLESYSESRLLERTPSAGVVARGRGRVQVSPVGSSRLRRPDAVAGRGPPARRPGGKHIIVRLYVEPSSDSIIPPQRLGGSVAVHGGGRNETSLTPNPGSTMTNENAENLSRSWES